MQFLFVLLTTVMVCATMRPMAGHADLTNQTSGTILGPTLKGIDSPKETYKLDDTIYYKVRLQWSKREQTLRMKPPDIELVNLELLSVSEESVASSRDGGPGNKIERVLNFKFRALAPGPAAIKNITLEWNSENSFVTTKLSIPGLELKIERQFPWWLAGAALSAILVGVGSVFGIASVRRRKLAQPQRSVPSTESAVILNELHDTYQKWNADQNHQQFFNALSVLSERFLSHELNWHPSGEDDTDLEAKILKKWTRKDYAIIKGMLRMLEEYRFSGVSLERKEIEDLYQTLKSFIERKRIIETS